MASEQEIRALLQTFQDGYTRRDLAQVDAFKTQEQHRYNLLDAQYTDWYNKHHNEQPREIAPPCPATIRLARL